MESPSGSVSFSASETSCLQPSFVKSMAVHDIMTGLLNRRGYMEHAPVILNQARAEGKYFVLLSADMNRMKTINDQYGHMNGDEAI